MNKEKLWNKISRMGLAEGQDVMQFREVILLNRILVVMLGVMCLYVPLEIFINGLALIPMVLFMMFMFSLTLVFHHFKFYKVARYYLFFSGVIFIGGMGLSVGKNVGNYVSLIPVVLVAVILFKTKTERIFSLLFTIAAYLFQHYLFGVIEPVFIVLPERVEIFSQIFFVLSMVLTFVAGFYLIRTNVEYEEIIIHQKEKMESKNKEVTDSINYAKRIQAAILPSDAVVKEHFPESFILYKPKDIVAGDFYWLEEKNNLIIFAAADCTGHGVPGAMVSVICNNALNRSVREFELTKPGEILDKAREIVIAEFEKSNDEVKDGMDISLCCYNPKTMELWWAGANNPLLLINSNGITEFKANKQPIGKYFDPKPYTTHYIQLKKNDHIFIFTDGFQDQFGGEKGKKFKASNLKELFLKNKEKPIAEQCQILDHAFESWKGELEQIDDVCVIGIRI